MASNVQALLRFLTNRKVPLQTALRAVKQLNEANLNSIEDIASSDIETIQSIFHDDKVAKSILSAAKRETKLATLNSPERTLKRSASNASASSATSPSPLKRRKSHADVKPEDQVSWEDGLELPELNLDIDSLSTKSVFTNRAPFLLAFAITSLKFTSPHLPLSSVFSLSQCLLDTTSRTKAKFIGIKTSTTETSALEPGHKTMNVLGVRIPVLQRYDTVATNASTLSSTNTATPASTASTATVGADNIKEEKNESQTVIDTNEGDNPQPQPPSFWGLSLDLLQTPPKPTRQNPSALPICVPYTSYLYLLRSFKGDDLRNVLGALEIVHESWKDVLNAQELDKRSWAWYCRVRPVVEEGKKGWGGRAEVRLSDLLELRRKT